MARGAGLVAAALALGAATDFFGGTKSCEGAARAPRKLRPSSVPGCTPC